MVKSKKSLAKRIIKFSLLILIIVLAAAGIYLNSLLDIITGYAAKNLASGIFVSGRTQEDMEETDLNFSFIASTNNTVDPSENSVTSRFLWGKSKAIYRDGFGVSLLRGKNAEEVKLDSFNQEMEPGYSGDTIPWPMGDILPDTLTGIDINKLETIVERLITYDAYGGSAYAFIVLHHGNPVVEAYKKRFSKDTKFLSWSISKSITNGLLGVLSHKGVLDINQPVNLKEWTDDDRSKITWNMLMQMQSGLHWNENYGNRSDVTVMLHEATDFAKFAYNQILDYDPGTNWYYSSGTANIVSYLIRDKIADDKEYYSFPHRDFFYKIGIRDAVIDTDMSGNLVLSSYLYMTARDYARYALLYLQDGVFNNERVLPEGWVDYTRGTASASGGEYGSFFWLNQAGELPSAPEDMYMCIGHDGQRILVLPSQDLAVIVLGYSPNGSMDFDTLIKEILELLD